MKKIAKGYYYNVYDLGNGRVRKIPRNIFSQIFQLFEWYIITPKILVKELSRAPFLPSKVKKEHELAKKFSQLDKNLFGNVVFFDNYICEQDKIDVLGNVLKNSSLDEKKELIDKYIQATYKLWSLGVADKIFNFTLNCGVDKNNDVIFCDINEMTDSFEEIEKRIKNRRFFIASSYLRIEDKALKDLVTDKFNEAFTLEKLKEGWGR